MSAPVKQDAAFRWTENGQDYLHYLGAKIRRPTANPVQQVHRWRSADLTTERVISIGAGVQDLSGTIRFDGSPTSLAQFIAAGQRGASIEYVPSLSNPDRSYPCVLVEAGEIVPDPDLWFDRRYQVDVRLRRIDGGDWRALLEGTFFYWQAGNLLPGTLFTRAGVAPYLDGDGSYQEAAANIARYSYLTEDVGYVGGPVLTGIPTEHGGVLLLEPAGTNVWLRSDEFDDAAWTKAQATIDADDTAAPDGTTTADKLVETTDAGTHTVAQALGGSPTDNRYSVISVHAKADERDGIWMSLTGKDGSTVATARYDLVGGFISAITTGGTLTTLAAIRDAGDGWYRCILAGDMLTGGSTPSGSIGLMDGNDTSYTGDGTSGVHLWRGHAEVDRRMPSYAVQTAGATAAGVAEKMTTPPGFTMEDIRRAGGATFYTHWIERGTAYGVGSSDRYWQVGNGVRLLLFSGSAGDGTIDGSLFEVGGGSAQSSPSAVIPLGKPAEARLIVYLDPADDLWKVQLGVSVNGAAEVLGSVSTFGATLPDFDVDLLTFGSSHNATVQAPVGLRTIKGIGGVRTMAEMRKIAAARLYQRVA